MAMQLRWLHLLQVDVPVLPHKHRRPTIGCARSNSPRIGAPKWRSIQNTGVVLLVFCFFFHIHRPKPICSCLTTHLQPVPVVLPAALLVLFLSLLLARPVDCSVGLNQMQYLLFVMLLKQSRSFLESVLVLLQEGSEAGILLLQVIHSCQLPVITLHLNHQIIEHRESRVLPRGVPWSLRHIDRSYLDRGHPDAPRCGWGLKRSRGFQRRGRHRRQRRLRLSGLLCWWLRTQLLSTSCGNMFHHPAARSTHRTRLAGRSQRYLVELGRHGSATRRHRPPHTSRRGSGGRQRDGIRPLRSPACFWVIFTTKFVVVVG
mmetsp:Transcript_106494/g.243829  ORF Transcript_106494/g.243829 Transcript_106494/m.243829 type:complete len:316 (-) Transcript_106494:125-1072(-)